jgi:hypothetical protein
VDIVKEGKVGRRNRVPRSLQTTLLFFGRRPARASVPEDAVSRWRVQTAGRLAAAPYHDLLRLAVILSL